MAYQYMPKYFMTPAKILQPPPYILNVRSLNIKAFTWINSKQLNILKTFFEYLKFYIAAY